MSYRSAVVYDKCLYMYTPSVPVPFYLPPKVVGKHSTNFSVTSKKKWRDHRSSRAALLDKIDSLEEGGIRSSSSYSSGLEDHDNDKAMDSLHDRVSFLKRLTGDVHEEVESHNRMLDRMGNDMDASRGFMSGTIDRFKMVFEKKSNRRTCKLAMYFVVGFFVLYYIFRTLLYLLYG